MNKKKLILFSSTLILMAWLIVAITKGQSEDNRFISYELDLNKQHFKLYWKDEQGQRFKNLENLKKWLESKNRTLLFAMNGGMFKADHSAQGLFIQDQQTITVLDTTSGTGNFYLKPNGVFYTTMNNVVAISTTEDFLYDKNIQFATQSGPMLVINGQIHPAFKENSMNLNIRNGVGVLPNNKVIFAMSKTEISFYDFANYFKKLGCKNALYLDGLVSRTYLPGKNWLQTDGDFGVIIGVTKPIQ